MAAEKPKVIDLGAKFGAKKRSSSARPALPGSAKDAAGPSQKRPRRETREVSPPITPAEGPHGPISGDIAEPHPSAEAPPPSAEPSVFFRPTLSSHNGKRLVRQDDNVRGTPSDPSVPYALLQGLGLPKDLATYPTTEVGLLNEFMAKAVEIGQVAFLSYQKAFEMAAMKKKLFEKEKRKAEDSMLDALRQKNELTKCKEELELVKAKVAEAEHRANVAEQKASDAESRAEQRAAKRFDEGDRQGYRRGYDEAGADYEKQVSELVPKFHRRGYLKGLDASGVPLDSLLRQSVPPVQEPAAGEEEEEETTMAEDQTDRPEEQEGRAGAGGDEEVNQAQE